MLEDEFGAPNNAKKYDTSIKSAESQWLVPNDSKIQESTTIFQIGENSDAARANQQQQLQQIPLSRSKSLRRQSTNQQRSSENNSSERSPQQDSMKFLAFPNAQLADGQQNTRQQMYRAQNSLRSPAFNQRLSPYDNVDGIDQIREETSSEANGGRGPEKPSFQLKPGAKPINRFSFSQQNLDSSHQVPLPDHQLNELFVQFQKFNAQNNQPDLSEAELFAQFTKFQRWYKGLNTDSHQDSILKNSRHQGSSEQSEQHPSLFSQMSSINLARQKTPGSAQQVPASAQQQQQQFNYKQLIKNPPLRLQQRNLEGSLLQAQHHSFHTPNFPSMDSVHQTSHLNQTSRFLAQPQEAPENLQSLTIIAPDLDSSRQNGTVQLKHYLAHPALPTLGSIDPLSPTYAQLPNIQTISTPSHHPADHSQYQQQLQF